MRDPTLDLLPKLLELNRLTAFFFAELRLAVRLAVAIFVQFCSFQLKHEFLLMGAMNHD
jgi:hypothetical protein